MKIDSLARPIRLPMQIADTLRREIDEGRLKPGDRLPTEQFLAESFGVSRNVVREAIAQLRSAGMVYSRQGLGTIVGQNKADQGLRLDIPRHGDASVYQNIYELRAIVEIRSAGLAARRGTQAQFRAISRTLEKMRAAKQWDREGVDADLEFHLAVASASNNPYIAETVGFLTAKMKDTIIATRQRSGGIVREVKALTIDEHTVIHDAILARSAKEARKAMARHIGNAAGQLGYDLSMEDC